MNFTKRDLRSEVAVEAPYLRRFARALTNDPVFSDDLVQDTLERALTRLHLFDETRNLRTWLYTILRNLFINEVRKHGQRGYHVNIDEVVEHNFAQDANQTDSMIGQEIVKALTQLPDEQREVLVLVGLESMTYEETAKVVGVPVGTVMSRLSRARAKLRDIMDDDNTEGRK